MPKGLKRLTLKAQAEKLLREMIASYRFTPGKWINVESLAKELDVSRTPIWQALKDLEKEGLVNHVPNKGIRMAQMTLEMAYDLYTVRGLLEGLAGRLAAETIRSGTLNRLEFILKNQYPIIQNHDVVEYSNSDFEFHALIYDSCGNWLLKELLDNIKKRSRPFVCDITPALPELYEDHRKVVEAFRDRDPDAAESIMKAHNQRMQRQIEQARQKARSGPSNPAKHGIRTG
ncbi:MAG: GntR family transcriptional regulator [Deltaproteobacteria bacterium]|nr:GntR family transcriptional regulator [Deltaproteobacteria bacterium]